MAGTYRSLPGTGGSPRQGDCFAVRYRFHQLLGRGSFGEVWSAEDLDSQTVGTPDFVAIKLLHHATCTEAVRLRFKREMESLSRLRGVPNIVQILGGGEYDRQLYYVMEHVRGHSLAQRLQYHRQRGEPLPRSLVIKWFSEICSALGAAHRLSPPITHRDIKPSNIMLERIMGDEYAAKILDFGVARCGERNQTRTGEPIGTQGYMAPEQGVGYGNTIGPASDVFALGLLFIEMVDPARFSSGLGGQTLGELATQAPQQLRPYLRTMSRELPEAVWDVIVKALQVQAAERYPDALVLCGEFLKALQGPQQMAFPLAS